MKRKITTRLLPLLLCWILTTAALFTRAQGPVIIKGNVTDSSGQPVTGAVIQVKNGKASTVTDNKGEFRLTIPAGASSVITITHASFDNKEIEATSSTAIRITLTPRNNNLNDVIVVGYGKQKKASLTGSVIQINSDEIKQSTSVNISNALAGRMPGVIASNPTGEPGNDGSSILIRGAGTTGSTAPLYVIDGVANRGGFERLNPNDIESISVLKDAAASIYGAQAANGVILVTTKRGKAGVPTLSYDASFGLSNPTRVPKLVNAYEYAIFRNEKDKRLNGSSAPPTFSDAQIQKYRDGSDPLNYPSTDWYSVVLKDWTPQTTHSITISGGADRVKYFLSGNYTYQDAFYKNSATNYRQFNFRSNIDAQITKSFHLSADLVGRREDRRYPPTGVGATPASNIFLTLLGTYPGLAPYYPNGLPVAGIEGPNPLQLAEGDNGYTRRWNNSIQTLVNFQWDLPSITQGLSISGFAAHDFGFYKEKTFTKPFDLYRYDSTNKVYNNVKSTLLPATSLYEAFGDNLLKTYNIRLNYERTFGKHAVNAFIAFEQSDYYNEGINATRSGLISTLVDQMFANNTDPLKITNNGSADQNARRNYFGRVNYNYSNRYLAEFVFRRDGSFNFPPGKQYGNFPGVSVAWRLSEESFFRKAAPFVNQLKLRASYSETGSDRIAQYQYLNRYTIPTDPYAYQNYFLGNSDNPSMAPGVMPGIAANTDVTWEVEKMKNIGVDATLWNGVIDFTADYYWAKRSNILTARNASIPATAGLNGLLPTENIGIVSRHGIELNLGHKGNIGKDFRYNVSGNFTRTWSKVIFNDEAATVYPWQKVQGYQLGSQLIYKTAGIYHTQAEIDNSPHLPGTQPGDIRYVDYDGDKAITAKDQVRMYETATPLIVYGLTLKGDYKGFTLRMLWQGQAKAKQVILPQANNGEFIPPKWIYDNRWTPENPNGSMPGAFDRTYTIDNRSSEFWLKDMSFLKLKSAEIAYTFSGKQLGRTGIHNLRIYLNGNNLFSIDKVKYYDPETTAYTGAYYPQTRIYTLGLNLNF